MKMKRPILSLTNATTIAEREKYHYQPQRSHRLLKARLLVTGQDRLLSRAQKSAQAKEVRGQNVVIVRKDSDICHMAVGNRYYKRTPMGYLIEVTHWYGGPVSKALDSDSNSE